MMYGKPLKLLLQLACTGLLLTVIERQLFWGQIRQLGKFSSASSLSLVDGVCGGWRTFFLQLVLKNYYAQMNTLWIKQNKKSYDVYTLIIMIFSSPYGSLFQLDT